MLGQRRLHATAAVVTALVLSSLRISLLSFFLDSFSQTFGLWEQASPKTD